MGARSLILLFLLGLLSACDPGVPVVHIGSDVCEHCMMTVTDARFSAAIRTSTGKVHRFDSIECMTSFELNSLDSDEEITRWVSDYTVQSLVELDEDVVVVRDPSIRSPMAAGIAAYSTGETVPADATILELAELKEYVADLDVGRSR